MAALVFNYSDIARRMNRKVPSEEGEDEVQVPAKKKMAFKPRARCVVDDVDDDE